MGESCEEGAFIYSFIKENKGLEQRKEGELVLSSFIKSLTAFSYFQHVYQNLKFQKDVQTIFKHNCQGGDCCPSPEALLGCSSLLGVVSSPEGCNNLLVLLGCSASAGETDVEGRLVQSGPFAQGGPLDVLSFMVWDIDTDSVGSHVCLLVTHGVRVMFLIAVC